MKIWTASFCPGGQLFSGILGFSEFLIERVEFAVLTVQWMSSLVAGILVFRLTFFSWLVSRQSKRLKWF